MASIKSKEIRNKIRAEKKAARQQKRREAKRQKKLKSMEERFLVAVYGTFRKGQKHHINIDVASTKFVGVYETEPVFNFYSLSNDGFPGLEKNGFTSVKMEVYDVTEKVLKRIDTIEGYDENFDKENNVYIREIIDSPFGKVFVYFYNDEMDIFKKILLSGDWVDYIENEIRIIKMGLE